MKSESPPYEISPVRTPEVRTAWVRRYTGVDGWHGWTTTCPGCGRCYFDEVASFLTERVTHHWDEDCGPLFGDTLAFHVGPNPPGTAA